MSSCKNIGTAKQVGEAVNDRFIFPSGTVAHDDGFSPEFTPVTQYAFRNYVQGIVPGNALP
jgi:hypothetical protein